MIFDDLNEKNFLLYAMKEYNNPQCVQKLKSLMMI